MAGFATMFFAFIFCKFEHICISCHNCKVPAIVMVDDTIPGSGSLAIRLNALSINKCLPLQVGRTTVTFSARTFKIAEVNLELDIPQRSKCSHRIASS
ncbi:hypothetical protein EV361DRAFT_888383 [Lentinula raphanica]|nr:hypothetical protein EV361DRAFT_888383 [Lentinula raphanica]